MSLLLKNFYHTAIHLMAKLTHIFQTTRIMILFNRYFDKKGKALKKNKDNVTLLKNHNSGDGFLINSEKG